MPFLGSFSALLVCYLLLVLAYEVARLVSDLITCVLCDDSVRLYISNHSSSLRYNHYH